MTVSSQTESGDTENYNWLESGYADNRSGGALWYQQGVAHCKKNFLEKLSMAMLLIHNWQLVYSKVNKKKTKKLLKMEMCSTYRSLTFFIQRALRSLLDCLRKWKPLSCIVEVLSTRSEMRSPLSRIFSMLSTMTVCICRFFASISTVSPALLTKKIRQKCPKCKHLVVLASLTSPRRRLSVSALGLLEKNSICWCNTLANSSFMA